MNGAIGWRPVPNKRKLLRVGGDEFKNPSTAEGRDIFDQG